MPSTKDMQGAALLERADRTLLGDDEDLASPEDAQELYRRAVDQGSGAAAERLAMLAAVGVGRDADWNEALDFLLVAAVLGDRSARRQLAILADRKEERVLLGQATAPELWRQVRDSIDIGALLKSPSLKWLSEAPRIGMVEGLASKPMCDWLIRKAQNFLEPGMVNDAATGETRRHEMRTATAAPFTVLRRDAISALMQARVAQVTGLAVPKHEPPNVISYLPGQQFEPHVDYVDPQSVHFRADLAIRGQRIATCITYLNEDFEGAETDFPLAGLKLRGRTGDCIVFVNVLPDGQPDRRTLHAGLPPTRGRKWVLSQWLRDRPQPLA